jgi:hypothetical protein
MLIVVGGPSKSITGFESVSKNLGLIFPSRN